MLTFPKGTEFGRRLPKQKFYEHLDVSSEVKRLFVEQVRLITWANKLSPQTMNLAAGQQVTEIEVFRLALTGQELDPRVPELMDRQIPYHILFLLERPDGQMQLTIAFKEAALTLALTGQELDPRVPELMDRQIPYHILFLLERPDGQMQLTIAFKEAALTRDNAFRLRQRYATGWLAPEELSLEWAALDMDGLYEAIVRQIAGDAIAAPQAESLKEAVEQTQEREKLEKQIAALKVKMKKEKRLNKQMELRREIMRLEECLTK